MTAEHPGDDLAGRAASTVAVVVTCDRVKLLERSLAALAGQQPPPGHVVVVDNGADDRVRALVEALPVPATWLPSRRNLGGAGGFAYGMLHALALGADYVWLADDDGRPGSDSTLATLLEHVGDGRLAMASPPSSTTTTRSDSPSRRVARSSRSRPSAASPPRATTASSRASRRSSTGRSSPPSASRRSVCPTCGCSCAATRSR